ncbi:AbiV family abortive infection protein [Gemmata obscuriglobus]|uniref:AbiV family abortive infection protein n=1 Tax=Gemmata obscuriglobus TaxID=114 RepID=A0A2Z3H4V2_9BACT|nr:AbiV family abortive infection protein [Gemmata obscuriglobus]AWM39352.1 AbiV family abortive infection protein [Gemmata obscuriglobus]
MSPLTPAQIKDGMIKIQSNSRELIEDARVLFAANRFVRSFTLAHLASEELAKIGMLFRAGIFTICGIPVDWKSLRKRLANHKNKLRLESLWGISQLEQFRKMTGKDFANMIEKTCLHRNEMKNASIYVSIDGNQFVDPKEVITRENAERAIKLAERSFTETGEVIESYASTLSKPESVAQEIYSDYHRLMQQSPQEMLECMREMQHALGELIRTKSDKMS